MNKFYSIVYTDKTGYISVLEVCETFEYAEEQYDFYCNCIQYADGYITIDEV